MSTSMSVQTLALPADTGRMNSLTRRIHRRRLSSPVFSRTTFPPKFPHALPCKPLPTSVEALDLSGSSPFQKLASLHVVLLSYLEALEKRMAELSESSLSDMYTKGEDAMDEWARTGLIMLENIRAEVTSHLPEVHSAEEIPPSVEEFVRTHFMDLRSLPAVFEWDIDKLPDFASTASSMRERLDTARSRFTELDIPTPAEYMSRLSERLHSLHDHLSSVDIMPSLASSPILESVLGSDKIRGFLEETSTAVTEFIEETSNAVSEGETMLERAALDIANAVKRSLDGTQLIHYVDLPDAWKSNPFITQGYRFIPLRRWPLILMSLFALHNETFNIHTHFIPFIFWGLNALHLPASDTPEAVYTAFALLTLFLSTVWHLMAGCAHRKGVELCARIDYVGIGWLISASVGTVVYYGFECQPNLRNFFLAGCFLTGVTSNTVPFMPWFNEVRYRAYRLTFFVLLLGTVLVGPLGSMAYLHSASEMHQFVAPILPSLWAYTAGFLFYASQVPERFLPRSRHHHQDGGAVAKMNWLQALGCTLERLGLGSHAIWHLFIVSAIRQHRLGMAGLRAGQWTCPA